MATARPLKVETELHGSSATVTLRGELDIATVPLFEQAVESLLTGTVTELTVDLRPLSFLDSSGLRQFIVLHDRARSEGFGLALIRPAQPAMSIFQITRAEENLPFRDGPEDA